MKFGQKMYGYSVIISMLTKKLSSMLAGLKLETPKLGTVGTAKKMGI